jgi:hypothetical protein
MGNKSLWKRKFDHTRDETHHNKQRKEVVETKIEEEEVESPIVMYINLDNIIHERLYIV